MWHARGARLASAPQDLQAGRALHGGPVATFLLHHLQQRSVARVYFNSLKTQSEMVDNVPLAGTPAAPADTLPSTLNCQNTKTEALENLVMTLNKMLD